MYRSELVVGQMHGKRRGGIYFINMSQKKETSMRNEITARAGLGISLLPARNVDVGGKKMLWWFGGLALTHLGCATRFAVQWAHIFHQNMIRAS